MRTKSIIVTGIAIVLLLSCAKNKENTYSVSGTIQKGPYVAGTEIILYELNEKLGQTGRSFSSLIYDDLGNFDINNIELNSNLVLLTGRGYYYSEIYNKLSEGELTLHALAQLSDKDVVKVNVLTHVIKNRVEKLVNEGSGFLDAVNQAKAEFLSFLGVTEPFEMNFENLDISFGEDYNGLLLAFSIILQRTTPFMNEIPTLPAELTQLLARISNDFKDNGEINNSATIDTLLHNIAHITPPDIRASLIQKYNQNGMEITLPDFEKYLKKFQLKNSSNIFTDFTYPDYAQPEPLMAPSSVLPNLLSLNQTHYGLNAYSIAAYVPFDSSLRIKFTLTAGAQDYMWGGLPHGWKRSGHANGWILESQRENQLMTVLFHFENPGSATIEYYENESATPAFTKDIVWN